MKDKIKYKIIDKAILEINNLKLKYSKNYATMFIFKALDEAENKIGWIYANILEAKTLHNKEGER